jgi:hypothetical protein
VNPSDIESFTVTKRGIISHMRKGQDHFTPVNPSRINPLLVGSNIANILGSSSLEFQKMPLTVIIETLVSLSHFQS